jgi:uncharacterized protein HemX
MVNSEASIGDSTYVAGTAIAQTPASLLTQTPTSTSSQAAKSTSTTSDSGSTSLAAIAGPVLGGIAGAGLIALLLYWCCKGKTKGKKRLRFKIKRQTSEEKADKRRLRDAEEIAAEREKALRDLENRRRERQTQASFLGGFDFGGLGNDRGHANGVEPMPTHTASPRSPRWI